MFGRFTNWFRNFMMGRRGADQYTIALLVCYLVLTLLGSIFYRVFTLSLILRVLSAACAVWGIFRFFSRNISARDRENAAFLQLWTRCRRWCGSLTRRFRDRKTHVYIKCASCSAELRVPKGKGKLIVTCPKCKSEIRITT